MIMNVFISFWSLCVRNYHSIMGRFVAKIEMANIVCVIVETNFHRILIVNLYFHCTFTKTLTLIELAYKDI